MTIHFLAPEDKNKWHPIWKECFNIWTQTKYNLNIWTDEGIDKLLQEDDNEFYEEYLNKLDKIYKLDYVRYIILEKYGGAYFDMDVELKIDFLQWIDNKTVYLLEGSIGELVTNAIMITYKECKLWSKIKDKARFNIIKNFELAKQDNYHTVELVGPLFLSKWIAHFWNLQRQQTNPFPNIELLGYHQFNNPLNNFYFTRHGSTHTWGGLNQNYSI
jgi:mannosyltransferase OCH1-like enzyme